MNYINPRDPAVIPTHTKNPNSRRSLEPGGIVVKSIAMGSIYYEKIYGANELPNRYQAPRTEMKNTCGI